MNQPSAAFDHLIHWVDDLEGTSASYAAAGLEISPAIELVGFRNAVWGVDDERYVELAIVDDWDEVMASEYSASLRVLRPAVDALPGPGLLTFAVDVPDARAEAERLRAAGHDVEVADIWLEDRNAGFVEVFVRDLPSYVPFLITYSPPRAEIAQMRAAFRAERGIERPADRPDLAALLLASPDPEGDAQRLADLTGATRTGGVVALPGAEVRFEPVGADGRVGIRGLAVRRLPGAAAVEIAGVEVVPEG